MSAKFQSADFCALRAETAGMLGTQPDGTEKKIRKKLISKMIKIINANVKTKTYQ
jgi:hypothetical protein